MYYVYVLKSKDFDWHYTGITNNLERRLYEHNLGKMKSTKARKPYIIIYSEICSDRITARSKEKYLKSGIGREFIKNIDLTKIKN